MKKFILACIPFITLVVLSATPLQVAHAACYDWQKNMADEQLSRLPNGKVIVVDEFSDFTKKSGDDWLRFGIRNLLSDLLSTGKNLRVLKGRTAAYGTPPGGPDFKVGGKFQNIEGNLRIFVKLSNGKNGTLLKSYTIAVPYPGNKHFFTNTAETAKMIIKELGAHFDKDRIKAITTATTSTMAYETYIKGYLALEGYSPDSAKNAQTWFQQTKRIDYTSPLGYLGMIDTYTFLAFYLKQNKAAYSSYFQLAEAETDLMAKLAKHSPLVMIPKKPKVQNKKKEKAIKLENPFLVANIFYMEGIAAKKAGNIEDTIKSFKKTCETVPIDAIAWLELGRLQTAKGNNKAAANSYQRAFALNPCLR